MTTHDADHDPRNDDLLIWVDGALVPKDQAKVSVYDSGFMLGDGMWEGMRLVDGEWVFFDAHMDRLFESCRAVGLEIGLDRAAIRELLDQTAAANGMTGDAHCRLMVTRGRKARPFQHPRLSRFGPTIVAIVEHSRPAASVQSHGVRLATVPQVRGLPHSQDPKFNSHSKLNCVIACLQAMQAGADEALMLDPNGFVNTTNSCNFFIVRRGEVWTSTGDYCMNGITRHNVLRLCQEHGIVARERAFSLFDAYGAEEAFLTGTFGGLTPVASIDGKAIGAAAAASPARPMTERLRGLYRALVADTVAAQRAARPAATAAVTP